MPASREELRHTLARLARNNTPQSFLYGSGGAEPPVLIVAPRVESAAVIAARSRGHTVVTGRVMFSEDRRTLTFYCHSDPPPAARTRIQRLVGYPCAGFRAVRLDRTPDLARHVAALSTLQAGAAISWWMAAQGPSGSPVLLLDTDREALKETASRISARGARGRGTVRHSPRKGVGFLTRKPMADFAEALRAWSAAHIDLWPSLSILSGAQLVVRA